MYGLLTKLPPSRWLDRGQLLFFLRVYEPGWSQGPQTGILTDQASTIWDLIYGIKKPIFLVGHNT